MRPYIREFRPILIGVDGGADRLLEAGYTPHVIVGDMDSVSDKALRSGAELVVHAYPNGEAPGRERVDRLGLPSAILPAPGLSEDIAILLAHEKGAELIVAVPPPATIGVSLWGGADADDVTIMFACDLKKKRVSACNVTS